MFWWWCEDRSRSIRLDLNFLKRSHSGLGLASPPKKLEHTVDGRNPGPHVIYETVWKKQIFWMSTGTGFLPSPVFNYFFALVSSPKLNHPENSRTRNHAVKSMKKPTFWKTPRTLHKPWKKKMCQRVNHIWCVSPLGCFQKFCEHPHPQFFFKHVEQHHNDKVAELSKRLSENGMALGENGPKPCLDLGFVVKGRCSLLRCADPDRTWISSKYWGYFCRCIFGPLLFTYLEMSLSRSLCLVFFLPFFEMVILPKQTLTQQEETWKKTFHYP